MYSKIRTLNDDITLLKTRIDIPRDAIIDEIYIRFTVTVANGGQLNGPGRMRIS